MTRVFSKIDMETGLCRKIADKDVYGGSYDEYGYMFIEPKKSLIIELDQYPIPAPLKFN